MRQLRLALGQIELVVGDFAANSYLVRKESVKAIEAGAQLAIFPEMTLTGYPPEDLVFRESFGQASQQALQELAHALVDDGAGELAVVVGYLDLADGPRNASALLRGGEVLGRYFKHHLPNYGVFDEARYFRPGTELQVIRLHGIDVAMTICEDMWQEGGPFAVAREAGVDLVVNINGSPYERNKDDVRLELAQRRAREAGATLAYVNQVGGQDELVFDGDSFVVDAAGELIARAPQFEPGLYLVDLEFADQRPQIPHKPMPQTPGAVRPDRMTVQRCDSDSAPVASYRPAPPLITEGIEDEAQVWGALVLGTGDYVRKNGFQSVVLGLSGGIDSAVVAAVAADAIGGENVYCIALPSQYSSTGSLRDAEDLAQRIGAHYRVIPIETLVISFIDQLGLTGVAQENAQARVRGTTLMALSNSDGHLVLATGNKSELAVGYTTIYDAGSIGGFSPLKDVPKTLVWRLARWRNTEAARLGQTEPIPVNSIEKPPSAELRPGQLDSDSLPDYEVLDAILARYVDGDEAVSSITADGFDPQLVARVARLVDTAEWKRRQYPLGPKISFKAFGRDRRLPVTNRWREDTPPQQ